MKGVSLVDQGRESLNEVRPEVVKMGDEEIRSKFSKSSKILGKDEERNE